jgi:hypothetical protein
MKRAHPLLVGLLASIAIAGLASCGGGGGQTERSAATRQAFAQADANCRQMLREVKQLAKGVLSSGYANTLELTTEGFAKPGIDLVRQEAERQQALQAAAADPHFALYAELFDPIIVLAEQRLHAGQAREIARAQLLQDLLTSLGVEQRKAAHLAGLRDCDVDFLDAMVNAAS